MEYAGHFQHLNHAVMTKLPVVNNQAPPPPGAECPDATALRTRFQIKHLYQPFDLSNEQAYDLTLEQLLPESQEPGLKRLKCALDTAPANQLELVDHEDLCGRDNQEQQRLLLGGVAGNSPDGQTQITNHMVSSRRSSKHHQNSSSSSSSSSCPSQQQQQQPHVSCLYPEILAMIFSNLDVRSRGRAAQVCTAWRDAAYHKSAWRGVEARLHLKKHSSLVFNTLEKRGIKRVQILSLSLRRTLSDVFKGIKNLQSLNLSGCYNMTDSGLSQALVKPVNSLTELNLSLCKNITDASLSRIAMTLRNLEVLQLGGCGNVSNSGLQLVAWGLKKLKRLDLRSCWHISDLGVSYLAGQNPNLGGTFALEHLGLQDCQRVSDEGLRYLSMGLSNSLKSINLSFCVQITDSGMKHLAKITSLRDLDLRSCDNISEMGISYLAEGGSRISSLDVSFCDKIGDQALEHISQGLFNLKTLSMSACPISDEGISKIAKTQQELETLHIGQCSRLTDKSVTTIVENMPMLKCIDLYGCTKISKFGLEKIDKLRISLNLGLWQERR